MKNNNKNYTFNKRDFVLSRRDRSGGCGKCITAGGVKILPKVGGNITNQPFPILPHSNLVPNSNPDNQWGGHESGLVAVSHGGESPVYAAQMAHRHPEYPKSNLNQMGYPDYYAPQGISGADQKTIGMGWSSRSNGLDRIGHLPNGLGYNTQPNPAMHGGVIVRGQSVEPHFSAPPNIRGQYDARFDSRAGMMGMGFHGRQQAYARPAKRMKRGGCAGNIACAPCAQKRGGGLGGERVKTEENGENGEFEEEEDESSLVQGQGNAAPPTKAQQVEQMLFPKRRQTPKYQRAPNHQLRSTFVYLPNTGENLAQAVLEHDRKMMARAAAAAAEEAELDYEM